MSDLRKDCDYERVKKYPYTPDYPKSKQDAIELIKSMLDEIDGHTDFDNGMSLGLRIGIGLLERLQLTEEQ